MPPDPTNTRISKEKRHQIRETPDVFHQVFFFDSKKQKHRMCKRTPPEKEFNIISVAVLKARLCGILFIPVRTFSSARICVSLEQLHVGASKTFFKICERNIFCGFFSRWREISESDIFSNLIYLSRNLCEVLFVFKKAKYSYLKFCLKIDPIPSHHKWKRTQVKYSSIPSLMKNLNLVKLVTNRSVRYLR